MKFLESLKQQAIKVISALPENVDIEEIIFHRPYVFDKVKNGENAVREGKAISSEDLKKEVVSW
ncbi:hypothetical protein EST62_02125 [Chlorobaculum sp. 24CR]|nr:hypothetical protein EST62_02125 [Chlorobaculum sp. 24CR]